MIAVVYEAKHQEEVRGWLQSHQMKVTLANELPEHGFIVEGIAAGFIRRLENSKTALFDSLITNPAKSPAERNEAINLVVSKVITKARELGLHALAATSVDDHTLMRSLQFGFEALPHRAIILKL